MALPQKKETNQPNLNTGLGSVANDNTSRRPGSGNLIPPTSQLQGDIANRLAADRATKSGARRLSEDAYDNPLDGENEETPQNEEDVLPEQNLSREPEIEANLQAQLDEDQQLQAAVSMASRRQGMLNQIKKQEQVIDKEKDVLEKDLRGFRQSRARKFLSFFKPNITFLIERVLEALRNQANILSYKKRIAFLTGALVTIGTLIGILKASKFFTAFMDAAFVDRFSCLQMIIKTFETIVIPIIILLISPIWISFLAVLFLIGKFPLLKGTMTSEITEMIEKLEKQQRFWQTQLVQLQKIVNLEDQKSALEQTAKQIQRQP